MKKQQMKHPLQRVRIGILLSFLILCSPVYGNSQDSLLHLLKTDIPDTTRIDVLGELSKSLFGTQIDSAIYYAKEAVALSEKIVDEERRGYMLKNVGIGYYYKGDFVKTLDFWHASLAAFKKIDHPKGISNLLGNIGSVYNSTGDYPKALDYHLSCLRIAEKNKDDFRIATALQNIGAVYSNMEDFIGSKKYYEDALAICRTLEYEKGIATIVMNLSEVHRNIGEFDKAEANIKEAKLLFEKLKDPSLPEVMNAASHTYFLQKKYSKALSEAQKAYALAVGNNNKYFQETSLIAMGKAQTKTNQLPAAISSFQKAIQLGESIGVNIDLQQAYKGLVDALQRKGDYKKASLAQDSLLSVTRQLFDIEKNDKISNLQLEFNLEKRETEIALLNADNDLKSQKIAQAELQRNFLFAAAAFLFCLIGGIGYMYFFSRKKNKIISAEKEKSDKLLKNILPPETAEELKGNGSVQPKKYDFSTVLFTDFVNFTKASEENSPEEIVSSLDYYFRCFDEIIEKHQLEKIKTIGDAYMCAGGLHLADVDNFITTKNTLNAAVDILQVVQETAANPPEGVVPFKIRIGIDSGPVLAGVVGQNKFQYDIWGDTVNVASRMETNSEPNKINVSENIYSKLKDSLAFVYRGTIEVKNKGMMKMYFYS